MAQAGSSDCVSPASEVCKRIDLTLVRLKLSLIADEMRERYQRDLARLRNKFFDQDLLYRMPVAAAALYAEVNRTNEWAARVYQAYCEVWEAQGYDKSAAFVRAIYERVIAPLIAQRCSSVLADVSAVEAKVRFNRALLKLRDGLFRKRMRLLASRWDTKLAIQAREHEHALRIRSAGQLKQQAARPSRKPKQLSKQELRRKAVIFGAIQAKLKGPKYCAELDRRSLPIPAAWTEDGCPSKYAEAYNRGDPWRKKIHDEKHRFTVEYERIPAAQREMTIQSLAHSPNSLAASKSSSRKPA